MHFMKSGDLLIEGVDIENISKNDMAALQLTQEFILYALDRNDWMDEFFSVVAKISEQNTNNKPGLFLIKGGLDES